MNWAPAYLLLSLLIQAPPEPLAVAAAHLDAGRYAEAIAVLKPLAEKDPKDLVAHFDLALAYSMAGQSEPAIAGFRRVLELKPGLYEAQLNLGQLLEKSGQHAEAAEWLSQAVEQKPKDLRPVLLLGRALAGQSKWNDAVAALEKAAALDAADKDIQLELAQVCERAGQPDKALAIYARFADDAAVQEHRGLMLMARGDNEGARGALEAALVKSPSAALRYALATVYLRLKQPQKSVPLAAQMVEAEPANYDLRMFYGRLLRDQMQYAAAATQFAAAVKVRPDSGEAWNELTGMLLEAKQYEYALGALEKARQLNGVTPAYHYFKALMLDNLKEPRLALASYREFLKVSDGKFPDEEFKARHRAKTLERMVER